MRLEVCVWTQGDKIDFSFSAGGELEYSDIAALEESAEDEEISNYAEIKNPEIIKWDYIRDYVDDTLGESFWEEMNAGPEWKIIKLLETDPKYSDFQNMTKDEMEQFVNGFVTETLGTTEVAYELDGIDVTELVGVPVGAWNDIVFSEMTNSIMYEMRKKFFSAT